MNLNNQLNSEGYIIFDTELSNNLKFNETIQKIEKDLQEELNKKEIKKYPGYIMGNFGINQGIYSEIMYSLVFNEKYLLKIEEIIGKKINDFDIFFGGNVSLSKKGKQLFHTDGSFEKEMYMTSIATEDITDKNGPMEICVGTNKKKLEYWKFFFTKKIKKKVLLKKGQIMIRKHSLWHRGTKNYSSKPRLLLSFVLTPKVENYNNKINSEKFAIVPNFFKNNLIGKIHEVVYSYFSFFIIFPKLIFSIFKKKN